MLAGDPNPWRDIGHARWYDPLAILEDPSSGAFKEAVKEEAARWSQALRPLKTSVAQWRSGIAHYTAHALPHTEEYAHEQILWNSYDVKIQHTFGHRLNVWFTDNAGKAVHTFANIGNFGICPETDLFYTIVDVGNGAESLELAVYSVGRKKPLWKTSPVGPNAAFNGKNILYQTVENQLRYPGIKSADARSGSRVQTVYHESDKRKQVELYAPPHQPDIFIRVVNALDQRIGRIVKKERIEWIKHANQTLYPVSESIYVSNKSIHVHQKAYAFPRGYSLDAMGNEECVYITTTDCGFTTLYAFSPRTGKFTELYTPSCPNEIELLKHSECASVAIRCPNKPEAIYVLVGTDLVLVKQFPEPLALPYFKHGLAEAKDGIRVPYTVVSAVANPKKLIVEGYGAYGISAHRSYPIRWLQWLAKGYALAVAMPRGGREDGDAWYDGGRTAERKQNTFDDTAAVIHAVQSRLRVKPARTVFYGRSAGGLLAANIAQQYPNFVGAVYAEVPYLDVLRTTSNPALPLTQLEYDEFGDPIRRPQEYAALQKISPVDTVPPATTHTTNKTPLVIVKTAVNDTQVLPYESLKWSKKLRANGWTVYVGIDGAGGHFAAESSMVQQQAEDAALIDKRLHSESESSRGLSRRRRSASRSHTSRGKTRRRASS